MGKEGIYPVTQQVKSEEERMASPLILWSFTEEQVRKTNLKPKQYHCEPGDEYKSYLH